MKFLCDRCKTKYSIADEKVRRKILKIRCKNCTNIITVRDPDARADAGSKPPVSGNKSMPLENALSSAFSEGMDGDATALATNMPEFRPEAMGMDEEWYFANSGNQQGPVPFGQLAMMVERAQVKEDSFIWRDGFEDWLRADAVPELRPFFKKKAGTPAPATKALPKREVPRPTDGKLAGRKPTPAAGLPAGGSVKIDTKQPRFDIGEDSLPDLSDSLELDDNDSDEHDTTASGPLGESVSDAVSGLFAKADSGKIPDHKAALPSLSDEKEEKSDGMGLDLNISEPSRIVKLDAILAAGAAARAGNKPVSNSTGEVFKLPGLSDDAAAEALSTITGSHSRPVLPAMPNYVGPSVMLHHRDHRLYKMLAIGGGVVSLLLIVVVVMLLHPGGGTKTIVIEKEKTPEDIGAEFAEQIAREEAAKKFGPIAAINKRNVDSIPPAHGAGGPPPRRSTMPPQPPHKAAAGSGKPNEDQRLADLYGGNSGPNHSSGTPSPSRPAEDSLEPFKRGAKLCLDRALKKDPSLQTAKIDVKISITSVGGVSGVSIPSPYRDQFVGQCLSGVIKHLPWPSRGNPYDIDMPLLLSGG